MDTSKKASFVRKMGRKRLTLAKGGMIKRKHFDGGGIAGMLGTGGGLGGTGYDVTSGTSAEQINNAYNANQKALDNQSAVTSTLLPQINTAVGAQNNLLDQYGNQARGAGPNVAQNKLNQATSANVANQAALMAGQRGAGANPALIARQAAQVGAQTQQQAAGEAATLQAQQQIAAQQAQAQLASNQISQAQGAVNAGTQANQAEQGILQGANTANNNITGNLANTTAQGQQQAIGGIFNAAGAIAGLSEGGEVHERKFEFLHKIAKLGMEHTKMADGGAVPPKPSSWTDYFGAPQASAAADVPPASPPNAGAVSGQQSMRKAFGYADGGNIEVPTVSYQAPQTNFALPQEVQGGANNIANPSAEAMGDAIGGLGASKKSDSDKSSKMGSMGSSDMMAMAPMLAAEGGHVANYLMSDGGKVPALLSPGEIYLSPDKVHKVVNEGADPLEVGEKVPGKAKVKGDSKKNDFVKADLDEGGVVIDRENVMNSKKASKFVHKAIAKKKVGGK